MLTKQKGDIAMGHAIAYFLSHDYEVFLPIGDKGDVDLIVQKDEKLARVQVKYAGWYTGLKKHIVALRVMGDNQSFHTIKRYSPDSFEFLFVCTAIGDTYLLPWKGDIVKQTVLHIESIKYDEFRVHMQG
jgi:hypothetical protein